MDLDDGGQFGGAIGECGSEEITLCTDDGQVRLLSRRRQLQGQGSTSGSPRAGQDEDAHQAGVAPERPAPHSRCLVHYKGTVDESGEVFMDTRADSAEPVTIVAGRVASPTQQGLAAALCHMSKGETAQVKCPPQYGYGDKGSFSFPSVPPNAHLTYEVELIDWEAPAEFEDPQAYMFFEDKLEAAERRRLQGNELFRAADIDSAMGKYSLALSFLPEDLMFQLEGFHEEAAWKVKLPTLLNLAACQLKLQDYQAAIATCGQALERDPSNVKALFRRGSAKQALGQTDAARKDLEEALRRAPNDSEIKRGLQALRKEERETMAATAATFRGKLAAKPAVPSNRADAHNTSWGPDSPAPRDQDVLLNTYSVAGLLQWLWQSVLNLIFGRG